MLPIAVAIASKLAKLIKGWLSNDDSGGPPRWPIININIGRGNKTEVHIHVEVERKPPPTP
jgi:hypothetical protein